MGLDGALKSLSIHANRSSKLILEEFMINKHLEEKDAGSSHSRTASHLPREDSHLKIRDGKELLAIINDCSTLRPSDQNLTPGTDHLAKSSKALDKPVVNN